MSISKNSNTSIGKIKLINDGRNGIRVSYEKPSSHKDFNFRDDYIVAYKAPVNRELKAAMEVLRPYAMDLLQLHSKHVAAEDVRVVGVSSDADKKFVITVVVRSYGNKEYTANTPCFKDSDASEYKDYHAVIEHIRNVYNEVRMYISESRMMDTAQLAEILADKEAQKNVDFDPTSVHQMSPEQLMAFCRQHLEQSGAIVIQDEEGSGPAGDIPAPTPKAEVPVIQLPLTLAAPVEEVVAIEVEVVEQRNPSDNWPVSDDVAASFAGASVAGGGMY